MKNESNEKINLVTLIFLIFVLVIGVALAFSVFKFNSELRKINHEKHASALNVENKTNETNNIDIEDVENTNNEINEEEIIVEEVEEKTTPVVKEFIDVDFTSLELSFLKTESQKSNKIYSPLSLKYSLKMLEDMTDGETKAQISKLIDNYEITKYESSENMSFANSLFIRDTFKDSIKDSYVNKIKEDYDAEVVIDSFDSADNVNKWVNDKTLKLIPEIVSDEDLTDINFALINALAIDMDWEEKFFLDRGCGGTYPSTEYLHEKVYSPDGLYSDGWRELGINVYDTLNLTKSEFINEDETMLVSGMDVQATINNYDIVKELGEENIKNIVSEQYIKFAKDEEYDTNHVASGFLLSEDTSDEGIKKDLDEYFKTYIPELNENYHKVGSSTEFSIYVDDDVKMFAKNLKEYNGTTLQYVGIMPTSTSLDKFIEEIDENKLNNYISSLKTIEPQNFKEGVVTRIIGHIPKFKFEYELSLKEDLHRFGVSDIFSQDKADLSNLSDEKGLFIEKTIHKSNIEFTQDGLKAAAATFVGGGGGGSPFDYLFDVPIEYIDITFNNPYMFVVRDIETNEFWFIGAVYEPLLWEAEPESERIYDNY